MNVTSYNKEFFVCLINNLNLSNVKYCIIGDYEDLPDSINHDIDFWTENINIFRKILFETISLTRFQTFIDNQTANGCNVVIFKSEFDSICLMKIDVLSDTSYKSVLTLVNSDVMAKNVVQFKNFYVSNPESEAVMHFLYPMFEWGKIKKDSYKESILKYYNTDVFVDTFSSLWGTKTSADVLEMISNERWNDICDNISIYKRKAIIRSVFKFSTYRNVMKATYYILKRKIYPSGLVLAFCGLDGAGKTTILNELNDTFINLLKQKKVYYGYWRPYVIPEIRELFGRKNSKTGNIEVDNKDQNDSCATSLKRNILVSFFKLVYYFFDYMLSNFKYGEIKARGGVVLFDRHYIDMVVHPQRFDMNLPRWVMLLFYKFIPKPDCTFFLYCTPEEIHQRKVEFSKEEIRKMTDDYMTVGEKIKNFIPIHTNTTIIQEVVEILQNVVKNK